MQPDPSAPSVSRGAWRVLGRRSWLRVLGLAATGALTAALTASVAPAAGTPVLPTLPVNTDLLGATGALPVETAPDDPTVFVPTGAAAPTVGAAVLTTAAALPNAGTPMPAVGPDLLGIPTRVLAAYQRAESTMIKAGPSCHVRWWMLAGIGRIEASHAEDGRLDAHGVAVPPIFGPVLNGQPGMAAVRDTDGGRLDADPVWDRAVGPMQFLPGSWQVYGAGGNPQNVDDAALAAARYLCAGGVDLSVAPRLASAIFNYNHSDAYVAAVLGWAHGYERGVTATPAAALGAQQVRITTLREPSAAAALQAFAAPARVLPAPARSRHPAGVAAPTRSPGRTTPATPTTGTAPAGGPVTAGTAPTGGPVTAGTAPAGGPVTAGTAPTGGPVTAGTAPAGTAPAGTAPAGTAPAGAPPSVVPASAPPCQPAPATPVLPAIPGPTAPPASAAPAPAAPAEPPTGTPVPTAGQSGLVTDLGTISGMTCRLATLTRPDGTVMTIDLSLLRSAPVVGNRVQFTGSLSPDGLVLLATTMTSAP